MIDIKQRKAIKTCHLHCPNYHYVSNSRVRAKFSPRQIRIEPHNLCIHQTKQLCVSEPKLGRKRSMLILKAVSTRGVKLTTSSLSIRRGKKGQCIHLPWSNFTYFASSFWSHTAAETETENRWTDKQHAATLLKKKKKTYEPTLKVMKMKSHVDKSEDRFQKPPKTNNSFFLFIDFVDQILHQKARLCTKLHDQSFFTFCLTQTLTCHVQDCKTHSVTLSKINARTRWKIYHFAFMYLCFIMHFKFPHTANSRHSAYQ